MELFGAYLLSFMKTAGIFAPILFICLHMLRPLFFLPVIFICISGGILFGSVAGSAYSLIGITLSSIIFYLCIKRTPRTLERLLKLKTKLIGANRSLTKKQIALLRLIPFIHFHLLSISLIELAPSFKEYVKSSLLTNIPLAVFYTSIGEWTVHISPIYSILLLTLLLSLVYLTRKKESSIKWRDFFQARSV